MYSFGGRGGRVIVVTNLNDSGPGSFRRSVENRRTTRRVIQRRGYHQVEDRIRVRAPYITIAGNTAPATAFALRATRSIWKPTT